MLPIDHNLLFIILMENQGHRFPISKPFAIIVKSSTPRDAVFQACMTREKEIKQSKSKQYPKRPNHRFYWICPVITKGLQKYIHQPIEIDLEIGITLIKKHEVGGLHILPFVVASVSAEAIALRSITCVKQGVGADQRVEAKVAAKSFQISAIQNQLLIGVIDRNLIVRDALPLDFCIAGIKVKRLRQDISLQITIMDAQLVCDRCKRDVDRHIGVAMHEIE